MSNTRRASTEGPLRQERYCSSPEFERGLMANLVAKRCSVLDEPAARELIWFLQYLSHEDGGLKKLADDLCRRFPERLATATMQEIGFKPGQIYSAKQVRAVREEMADARDSFLLRGEFSSCDELCWPEEVSIGDWDDVRRNAEKRRRVAELEAEAAARPTSYPGEKFVKRCRDAAREHLAAFLERVCLDPSVALGGRWYFPTLIMSLRDYQSAWVAERQAGKVTTEIGQQVNQALDYALETRRMVLIDGSARIGKSHAAKAWCESRPGRARYVQVPSTNDEIGFFRAIAQSLGVSIESSPKAHKLRTRIESALEGGDLMLVFDEAHYLWPQSNYRHATPSRITWLMTALINSGVATAIVTTPQFFRSQKAVEQRTCWTAEQLTGRIGHFESLPAFPSDNDLALVARAALGDSKERAVEYLVDYAKASKRYLAGIDAVVSRARYVAQKAGRDKVTTADIRQAITASVIPSDSALVGALESNERAPRKRSGKPVAQPMQAPQFAERSAPTSAPTSVPVEPLPVRGQLTAV